MKKVFCVSFILMILGNFVFANKSRFFKNGNVIDRMYVDSDDGLRVRDKPSLKSNRLCAIQYNLPVKIVAIGKEETIDNITAPWVEILLPRYEWKGDEPEYGWVFGGYLSNSPNPKFVAPKTMEQLKYYIEINPMFRAEYETSYKSVSFCIQNNVVVIGISNEYGKDADQGVITYLSKDSFSYAALHNEYTKGTITLSNITKDGFNAQISGCKDLNDGQSTALYFRVSDEDWGADFNSPRLYFTKMSSKLSQFYVNDYERRNGLNFSFPAGWKKLYKEDFIEELIKSGVNLDGTSYESNYYEYWDSIMYEHQIKADK